MYKIIGADQKEYGPITLEQMRQWIAEGRVNAQTIVWSEASGNWKPITTYPEFAPHLLQTAQPGINTPYVAPTQLPRTNTCATIGMILGIVSLPSLCCCYGFPFNIAAIVVSAIALFQIKSSNGNQTGRGMAITGIALGILSIVVAVAFFALGFALSWDEISRGLKTP